MSFWVDPSTTALEKGLVKCHMSASQVLNAPTYYTTLAPNLAPPLWLYQTLTFATSAILNAHRL